MYLCLPEWVAALPMVKDTLGNHTNSALAYLSVLLLLDMHMNTDRDRYSNLQDRTLKHATTRNLPS